MSEVSTLRRAFSWITRSSPSYANRPVRSFCGLGMALSPAAIENGGHQELPDAEGERHGVRGKSLRPACKRKRGQPGAEVPHSNGEDRARQRAAGGKQAEAEYDLPKPRQHPQTLRCKSKQHEGEERPRNAGGNELLRCRVNHRIR